MNQTLNPSFALVRPPRVALVAASWHKDIVDQCRIAFTEEMAKLAAISRVAPTSETVDLSRLQITAQDLEVAADGMIEHLSVTDPAFLKGMIVCREELGKIPMPGMGTGTSS